MNGAYKHIVHLGRTKTDQRKVDRLLAQLMESEKRTDAIREKLNQHFKAEKLKAIYAK